MRKPVYRRQFIYIGPMEHSQSENDILHVPVGSASLNLPGPSLNIIINGTLEVGELEMPSFSKLLRSKSCEFAKFDSCVSRFHGEKAIRGKG